jgi:electron transport complex protein RnfB
MIAAVLSLTLLGVVLGWMLGLAARYLRVESNPLHEEIQQMLPGVNCGQCGYPGCNGAAEALAASKASVTLCPPGGPALVQALAAKLGVAVEGASSGGPPLLARIDEATCIGCAHCGKRCPTDAIVGAPKQIHGVIQDACIGCGLCLDVCPTECLRLHPQIPTLTTWCWPKPAP